MKIEKYKDLVDELASSPLCENKAWICMDAYTHSAYTDVEHFIKQYIRSYTARENAREKEIILEAISSAVSDAVSSLLCYKRLGDKGLPPGAIEDAIASGIINKADIVKMFDEQLRR